MYPHFQGSCLDGILPFKYNGWSHRHYKMFSDHQQKVLLSQSSRATESIHYWLSYLPAFQERVNLNVPAMTKISMDMKEMPPSNGYTHILVILCEVSNFMVALPLHSTRTQTILDAFQKGYLAYFGPPTHIMCEQDTSFSSSLMEASAEKLNIRMIMVSTTNHKSLLAEHGIKSLSNLLVKHLSGLWS